MTTLTTSEVRAIIRMSPSATTMLLTCLTASGLVSRLRPGFWLVGRGPLNQYALPEALTAPFDSYVSLQTALYLHGMIEQVPGVIYVVSLARSQRIRTAVGVYSIHHLAPELFDGFETRSDGTKLATSEKALFDIAYFSGGRSRLFTHVPELELPSGFRRAKLKKWVDQIDAVRRRSMVSARLQRMLDQTDALATPRKRRMRTPAAIVGADAAFSASPEQLGLAAVKAARKRR